MKIRLLYFASLRDLVGMREEELTLPEGMTVEGLREHLAQLHPRLQEAMNSLILSVNREYGMPEAELRDGDVVAIFPPISGG
jgi:molybdopterin converting factor subunit 1